MKEFLSVEELRVLMGISKNKAYELLRMEGFPSIEIGKRKIIPHEEFRQWVKENSYKEV